jgi:hypothetical protein
VRYRSARGWRCVWRVRSGHLGVRGEPPGVSPRPQDGDPCPVPFMKFGGGSRSCRSGSGALGGDHPAVALTAADHRPSSHSECVDGDRTEPFPEHCTPADDSRSLGRVIGWTFLCHRPDLVPAPAVPCRRPRRALPSAPLLRPPRGPVRPAPGSIGTFRLEHMSSAGRCRVPPCSIPPCGEPWRSSRRASRSPPWSEGCSGMSIHG